MFTLRTLLDPVGQTKLVSDVSNVPKTVNNKSLRKNKSTLKLSSIKLLRACSYGGEPARLPGWSSLPRSHLIPHFNTKLDFCSYE